MIKGWQQITETTGFHKNTLKKLVREENFPVTVVRGSPCTSRTLIDRWLQERILRQRREAGKNPAREPGGTDRRPESVI